MDREIAQWVHYEGSIQRYIALKADAFTLSYVSLLFISGYILLPATISKNPKNKLSLMVILFPTSGESF